MHSKTIKIIFTVVLTIFCIICMMNIVMASTDNFDFNKFDNKGVPTVDEAAQSVMGTAIQVIRIVGTGVSIVMLSYIGIKYMTAAPSEKADFKKSATIFVIGAILIFGATQILAIVIGFADTIFASN